MSWSVYVHCTLCSARTPSFSDPDHEKAGADAEAAAREAGFIELPAVREPGEPALLRVRVAGHWLCGDCARDVNHATAFKAADELRTLQERGGMPCAHTIGDLIGGDGAVTKCGQCLAEKQAKKAPEVWEGPRRYLANDCDQERLELVVAPPNGNGDWYVSVLPEGHKIGPTIRITTSGVRPGYEGVSGAVMALYKALPPAVKP